MWVAHDVLEPNIWIFMPRMVALSKIRFTVLKFFGIWVVWVLKVVLDLVSHFSKFGYEVCPKLRKMNWTFIYIIRSLLELQFFKFNHIISTKFKMSVDPGALIEWVNSINTPSWLHVKTLDDLTDCVALCDIFCFINNCRPMPDLIRIS